jgi:hypothetical protein
VAEEGATPQDVANQIRNDENRAAIEAAVPYVVPKPKIVKPVPITLDRERTMVMNFRAMKTFHKMTGLSPWSRPVWDDPSPDIMAALLYCALSHEDPRLTLEDVENMPGLEMGNMAYIHERIGELWGETMPDEDAPVAATEPTNHTITVDDDVPSPDGELPN